MIYCDAYPVVAPAPTPHPGPSPAPLEAALGEHFAIDTRTYGQSGLYNALYQSDLRVEGIDIRDGEAIINLSGTFLMEGVCDEPRVRGQIEQTALQFSTIDRVTVSLNGELL
ncbi:MAG: GerMN domain-containing protein [Anaerolineae bacterium]|nr:GerMN domain-containing protein [Anaerolineae bacterium]